MLDTKMLIVDDDTNICDLLKRYFENEGYSVKTANNGADGVSFFKVYDPDIVLLDIMLPKKDGWQVCREIREVSSKPVIMITAKGDVFDKVLGLDGLVTPDVKPTNGLKEYKNVIKPFKITAVDVENGIFDISNSCDCFNFNFNYKYNFARDS